MQELNECDIANLIRDLKQPGMRVQSNCFYHFLDKNHVWQGDFSKQSLIIVYDDKGIKRIWFYTTSFNDLQDLLDKNLDDKQEYLIDIVSKDKKLYLKELNSAGFKVFTCMARMANRDITGILNGNSPILSYGEESVGIKPALSDAGAIKSKLWEIFDTRVSHLPNQKEVEEGIKNKEYTIYKNETSEIVTILQSIVKPSSFYINQVYNGADKRIIHSILLNELKKYNELGGKYVYAWVEESNIASQKFHEKYGMQQDGLWNVIYMKEKQ